MLGVDLKRCGREPWLRMWEAIADLCVVARKNVRRPFWDLFAR